MDNQDTLYNQIKSAAQNAESKEFPAMDKVWNRVEEKLDHKVLTKQNTLWKKIAVAASILLVVSIGYHFMKEDEKVLLAPQKEAITKIDTTTTVLDTVINQNTVAVTSEKNPNIKEDVKEIIDKQIGSAPAVAANEMVISESDALVMQTPTFSTVDINNMASSNSNTNWLAEPNFKARGVIHKDVIEIKEDKIAEKPIQESKKKHDPLVVINDLKSNKQEVASLSDDEIESIVVLDNPLYIINGTYYTEQEVFGPNPTSPYSPLNQQAIESISILQDEKAVSIYGEKGKKGVVIITTKNGKPTPKKKE